MIKITSDSSADLNQYFEENNISVLPLVINFGTDSYQDLVDITPAMLFDEVAKRKTLPKTAARSEMDFYEFFKQFTDQGMEVIHFNISSCFSVSNSNAIAASKKLPNVFVVDSLSLSSGTALLELYAVDLIKEGKTAAEIVDAVNARRDKVQASFMVDTMEYLHKGGRCSGLTSIIATVLKIKPSIFVADGKMHVGKKYMGNFDKNILRYVDSTLAEFSCPDTTRVFITHSSADKEIVDAVADYIKSKNIFKQIITTVAGCTITTHCGKGTLGILYINDGTQLINS